MMKWVALLRGINVSGHKLILMADLRAWMEAMGFRSVATYIQSGNVVFSATERSAAKLARDIRAQILARSGFDVPVLMRSAAQMKAVVKTNPFAAEAELEGLNVYVLFLSAKSRADGLLALSEVESGSDRFEAFGKEIYAHFPNGILGTKLGAKLFNTVIQRNLGVDATSRNWKTVLKLNEMLANLD